MRSLAPTLLALANLLLAASPAVRAERPAPGKATAAAPLPALVPPIYLPPGPVEISGGADPAQFLFYFRHLAGLDGVATRAEAAGQPEAAAWRTLEQRASGLTAAEGEILRAAAFRCNQQLADHDAAPLDPEAIDVDPSNTRLQIVGAVVDELRSALGETAFQGVVGRVETLFGYGTVDLEGDATPLSAAPPPRGANPGPPVEAQIEQSILISARIVKLDRYHFAAECDTGPTGDIAPHYYQSTVTACVLYGTDRPPVSVPCDEFGAGLCLGSFPSNPGQTYQTRGVHGLRMYPDTCNEGFGDYQGLQDLLHFGFPPGSPLRHIQGMNRLYPLGGPVCWQASSPDNSYALATSESLPVSYIGITPRETTLFAGQTQQFTANMPAVWSPDGPGTVSATGLYTAPPTLIFSDTSKIVACDSSTLPERIDCTNATINLQFLRLDLSPEVAEVLPGGRRVFNTFLYPSTPPLPVTWTLIDPTHSATIVPIAGASSSAVFTAPPKNKLTATQEIIVQACVSPNSATVICHSARVLVPKLQVYITAPKRTLVLGETVQLTGFVNGSSEPRGVDWTDTPKYLDARLAQVTPDTLVETYTASPFQPGIVNLQICLKDDGEMCSDLFPLEVVPPVTITSVTGPWNAGELASPFSIMGTGFGLHPAVSFEGLQATVLSASDSLITGVAVVPVAMGGGSTRVQVTVTYPNGDDYSTFYPIGSRIPIVPVSTLGILPASTELHGGESQVFNALCLTAQGAACSSPETVRWSASAGTIVPTTGVTARYTAPAAVPADATATVSACWGTSGPCALPAHVTLRSGTGVAVAVTPSTATVLVGQTKQFTATVTGSGNTQVTWSLIPQTPAAGGINSSGVYSAPAALGGVTTVTVVATSQADGTKWGSATVTLAAPSQPTLICTPSPTTVNYGSTITWTCTASGGNPATLQYALFRQRAGTPSWIPDVTSPAWQASNVLTWTPSTTDVDTWVIILWVRDGNTPASMNGYGFAAYCNAGPVQVTAPAAPLTVTGTASPPAANYGTTLGWTAYASGGTPGTIQYAFFRRKAGTGSGAAGWIPDVTQPAWQPGNTFTWTPNAGDAGTWETYVWVRDANTPPNANGYGFAAGYNPGPVEITVPLSQVYPAKGWVDGYDTQHIWGWACDPDYPDQSNRVDFYTTGGQPLGSTGAFIDSSAAIAAQCLGGYSHYFDFYPSGGIPSGTHFNAWSIDLPYATPGNDNRRCGGSGAIGDGTEFVIP